VASLSQGRTAAAQCGLFTHKSVPVIFEPPCITEYVGTQWDPIAFRHTLLYAICSSSYGPDDGLSRLKRVVLLNYIEDTL